MHCRACGHANRDDARFCENCGRETRAQAAAGGRRAQRYRYSRQRAQQYSRQTGGGYASSEMREPLPYVPNHLVLAILVTIFGCLPFGIVAIVCAAQVNGRLDAGDYEGAKRASDWARAWAIISVIVVALSVAWVAWVIFSPVIFSIFP